MQNCARLAISLWGLACMSQTDAAPFHLRSEPPGVFELTANDLSGYTANAHSLYLNYDAQGRLLRARDKLCARRFVVELADDRRYPGRFLCSEAKAPPSGAYIDLGDVQGARVDIQWGGRDPDRRSSSAFESWLAARQLLYRRQKFVARCLSHEPTSWRRAAVRFNFALDAGHALGLELELILYYDGVPGAGAVLAALGVAPGRDAECTRQSLQLTLDVQQAPSRYINLVAATPIGD